MRHAVVHDSPNWGKKAVLGALLKLVGLAMLLTALLAFPALSQRMATSTLELSTPMPTLRASDPVAIMALERDRAVRAQRRAEPRLVGLRPIEVRDRMSTAIHFDVGSSAIRPDAIAALESKLDLLRGIPALQIRIEGQADVRGSNANNITLAWERAEAAKRWLTSRGIPSDRIDAVGFSTSRPICEDRNESCLWQNRRAEFVIVAGADADVPRRTP